MAMPQMAYLDSELELVSLESARFTWAGGDYRGRPALGADLAEQLLELETDHEAYGLALYEAVFPRNSELREGLREAILAAEQEKSRLRFRLHLPLDLPDWVHALYWELLADPDRHLALARSPDTAFSRYLDARRAQGVPAPGRPRLLCVVSAPSNITERGMAEIRRNEALRKLEASFEALADDVEVEFLEPPATLRRLRERLLDRRGFQLLHFVGHGERRGGVSSLVLEDEQGRAHFVEEKLLAEVFLGVRELRLVTLVACHGGAPSPSDPFSGLAGRLVHRGVPSVIAMHREVRVDSAHLFTRCLYHYITQTGRADAAVNEARQKLFLAEPKGIDWCSPVLYSRLSDGRLWLPQTEAGEERFQTARPHGPFFGLLPWLSRLMESKRVVRPQTLPNSEEFLSPAEVARRQARRPEAAKREFLKEFGGPASGELVGDRDRWRREGKIFAVTDREATYVPSFQFDEKGHPRPAVTQVIQLLGDTTSEWGLALWFAAANGWLDGRRPVDLLTSAPEEVVEAAEREAEELVF